jgi:chloride channel protein, CIC family
MLAIALSAGVSKLLSEDTVYTRKLLRRGIGLNAPDRALTRLRVASAAGPMPEALTPGTRLAELTARFAGEAGAALPVLGDDQRLRGVVLAVEVEQAVQDRADGVTAGDLARTVPALAADQTMEAALGLLTRHGGAGLPVVGEHGEPAGG